MVQDARDTVTDAGTSVLDTVKANPIPTALIGVGLGWLVFSARSDARRTGRRAVRGASRGIRRAETTVESTLRDNPLALGAIALAVGAAIGLSLPHTEAEDEWMGETKERLMHRAESVAGEALQKAEQAAGRLTGSEAEAKAKRGAQKGEDQQDANGLSGSSKSQAV